MADYRQSIPMSDPAIAGAFDRTRGDAPAAPKRRTVGGTIVTVVATLAIVGAVGLALKAPAVFGYKADLGVARDIGETQDRLAQRAAGFFRCLA